MITENTTVDRVWVEITNPFSVSNASSIEVEVQTDTF